VSIINRLGESGTVVRFIRSLGFLPQMSHRDLSQAVVALPAISDPQAIAGGRQRCMRGHAPPNEALADEIDRLIIRTARERQLFFEVPIRVS
jgi:hypothetical protein